MNNLIRSAFAGIIAITLGTALQLQAQDIFWVGNGGGGTDPNWSNGDNWDTGVPPVSNLDLGFAQENNQPENFNDLGNANIGLSVASIEFLDGTDSFTLMGNPIGFFNAGSGNFIRNNSENLQTLDFTGGLFGGIIVQVPLLIDAAAGSIFITSQSEIRLQAFLPNSADLTFDGDFTTVVGAPITGEFLRSGIIKNGAGDLLLNNSNTYWGGTTINDGRVQVGDPFALGIPEPNIFSVVFNDVVLNGGQLRTPEEIPLIFSAPDNYIQNGGTLRVQVGGFIPGLDHDLMEVGRDATLSSELFVHRIFGFNPTPGDRVTVITTGNLDPAGQVIGEFDEVNSDFPGLIQPFAEYFDQQVDLVFDLSNTFLSQALTHNQECVADALDHVAFETPFLNFSGATDLITFVGNLPLADLPAAFELISPDELASIYGVAFSQAVQQTVNLQRRLSDIRDGSTGFCSDLQQTVVEQGYSKEASDGKVVLNNKNVTPPAFVAAPDNPWGIFVTGSAQFVNIGSHNDREGYDIDNGSVLGGLDYRIGKHFAIGVHGGYSAGDADLQDSGHVQVSGGRIGGHATFWAGGFYVDVAGNAGWNHYDTRRGGLGFDFDGDNVPIIEADGVHGDTNGSEFNGFVGAGYDWHFGSYSVGPTISFQYTEVNIDSFTEQDSAFVPLHFPDQDEASARGTIGLRGAAQWKVAGACIRPEIRAAYLHEFEDTSYDIRWAFDSDLVGEDRHFCSVSGPNIGEGSALLSAGLAIQVHRQVAISAYYDGRIADHYTAHGVSGGFSFGF